MDNDNIDNVTDDDFDSQSARRAMRKRHLRVGLLAQEIALYAMLELKKKTESGQPLNMSGADAEKLLEMGRKIERAAVWEKRDDQAPGRPRKPS
jgi:hypothetical protein